MKRMLNLVHFLCLLYLSNTDDIDVRSIGPRTSILSCRSIKLALTSCSCSVALANSLQAAAAPLSSLPTQVPSVFPTTNPPPAAYKPPSPSRLAPTPITVRHTSQHASSGLKRYMRNFVTLKACALKPVTWSRLSKLLDNREDFHQAPRSDCASLRHTTCTCSGRTSFASLSHIRSLRLNTWHGKMKQLHHSSFSDVCPVIVDFPQF